MNIKIIKNNFQKFSEWWKKPNTRKDRIRGSLIGGIGYFWIMGLGRIILGELPVSIINVGVWAFSGVIIGAILGIIFPKIVLIICFPFSVFGISN
jgi:hypothetical protein